MKYVMFTDGSFIILPNSFGHKEMVPSNKQPISAGFCDIRIDDGYEVTCYGESTTLELKSREREDAIRMRIALNG